MTSIATADSEIITELLTAIITAAAAADANENVAPTKLAAEATNSTCDNHIKSNNKNLTKQQKNAHNGNNKDKKQLKQQKATAAHDRVNFLAQAAQFMAGLAQKYHTPRIRDENACRLSRKRRVVARDRCVAATVSGHLLKDMAVVAEKSQMKLHRSFKCNFCVRCKRAIVIEMVEKTSTRMQLSLKKRKGAKTPFVNVKCKFCGHVKRYLTGNYGDTEEKEEVDIQNQKI